MGGAVSVADGGKNTDANHRPHTSDSQTKRRGSFLRRPSSQGSQRTAGKENSTEQIPTTGLDRGYDASAARGSAAGSVASGRPHSRESKLPRPVSALSAASEGTVSSYVTGESATATETETEGGDEISSLGGGGDGSAEALRRLLAEQSDLRQQLARMHAAVSLTKTALERSKARKKDVKNQLKQEQELRLQEQLRYARFQDVETEWQSAVEFKETEVRDNLRTIAMYEEERLQLMAEIERHKQDAAEARSLLQEQQAAQPVDEPRKLGDRRIRVNARALLERMADMRRGCAKPPSAPPRLFWASTTKDCVGERAAFQKKVPLLRELCGTRGREFTVLDMRAGVDDDDLSIGQSMSTILMEASHCTYFAGFLGSLYGTPPDTGLEVGRKVWLLADKARSALDLETSRIIGAAGAWGACAWFYLRSETAAIVGEGVPAPRPEEKQRLSTLRERVLASGLRAVDGYSSAEEAAGLLYNDLVTAIERDYAAPMPKPPHPYAPTRYEMDEDIAQTDFFGSRAKMHCGLTRDRLLMQMDEHVQSLALSPLILHGPTGSGKASILASWADTWLTEGGYIPGGAGRRVGTTHGFGVVLLSTRATLMSASRTWFSRTVLRKLRWMFELSTPLPSSEADVLKAIPTTLDAATRKGNFVLAFDLDGFRPALRRKGRPMSSYIRKLQLQQEASESKSKPTTSQGGANAAPGALTKQGSLGRLGFDSVRASIRIGGGGRGRGRGLPLGKEDIRMASGKISPRGGAIGRGFIPGSAVAGSIGEDTHALNEDAMTPFDKDSLVGRMNTHIEDIEGEEEAAWMEEGGGLRGFELRDGESVGSYWETDDEDRWDDEEVEWSDDDYASDEDNNDDEEDPNATIAAPLPKDKPKVVDARDRPSREQRGRAPDGAVLLWGEEDGGGYWAQNELSFLPGMTPKGCVIIATASSQLSKDEATRRGWPILEVEELSQTDGRLVVAAVLDKTGRRLKSDEWMRLWQGAGARNAEWLRLVSSQMRTMNIGTGVGATSADDERSLTYMLGAGDITQLWHVIIGTWQSKLEGSRVGGVGEVLGLVASVRSGLSETECAGMLGLTTLQFIPVWSALREFLITGGGICAIGSHALRTVVDARYRGTAAARTMLHERIEHYFKRTQPVFNQRQAEELPYAYLCLKKMAKLNEYLGRIGAFYTLYQGHRETEYIRYWRTLGVGAVVSSSTNKAINDTSKESKDGEAASSTAVTTTAAAGTSTILRGGKQGGGEWSGTGWSSCGKVLHRALEVLEEGVKANHGGEFDGGEEGIIRGWTQLALMASELARFLLDTGQNLLAVATLRLLVRYEREVATEKADAIERAKPVETVSTGLAKPEPTSLELASACLRVGDTCWKLSRFSEGLPYVDECVKIRTELLGQKDIAVADALQRQGLVKLGLGDTTGAESAIGSALKIREDILGSESGAVAESMTSLAQVWQRMGKRQEAAGMQQRANALMVRVLRSDVRGYEV